MTGDDMDGDTSQDPCDPAGRLDVASFLDLLRQMHGALAGRREEIDRLNVFPVPDGDTGSNMVLTMQSALEAVQSTQADADTDADRIHHAVRGALRGARGNSGVILSQIVRGFADALLDGSDDPSTTLVQCYRRAAALADEAVADRVEGTILTVLDVAAQTAGDAARDGADVVAVSQRVCGAVHDGVARTREQLDVLRLAGVVDAGARGFELVADAVHAHLTGQPLDDAGLPPPIRRPAQRPETHRDMGEARYGFEVMYLLDADDAAAGPLRRALEDMGDSVVVVASGGLLSVHVHTNDIGGVIEAGIGHGRPSQIEVSSFAEQIAEHDRAWAAGGGDRPALGAVVVLPGPGLRAVAEEHGAVVVDGWAGNLPTVADILNAASHVAADRVVVLPGHPNAVPTADQAARVGQAEGGRALDVIETATSPPKVLAALAVLDPSLGGDDELELLRDAARACRSGEVVPAVRDAETPDGPVREGQFLAVVDGDVRAVRENALDALEQLVAECCGDVEMVTLVTGAAVSSEDRARALEIVRTGLPDGEIEVVDGGQHPAHYLLGAE